MKCSNSNCTTELPGKWEPCLHLWAEGHVKKSHKPMTMYLMGIQVCDTCKETLQISDFVSDDVWKHIKVVTFSLGKAQPDRDTAEVSFDYPVEDPRKRGMQ